MLCYIPCGALLISKFCEVLELRDEHSSMYEMARSPNGTLTEEHSLVVVEEQEGRKNSDRLSASSPGGVDIAFILFRRSWNGVWRQENNLCLEIKKFTKIHIVKNKKNLVKGKSKLF